MLYQLDYNLIPMVVLSLKMSQTSLVFLFDFVFKRPDNFDQIGCNCICTLFYKMIIDIVYNQSLKNCILFWSSKIEWFRLDLVSELKLFWQFVFFCFFFVSLFIFSFHFVSFFFSLSEKNHSILIRVDRRQILWSDFFEN